MSLINKMLQDLDARGAPGDGPLPSHVMPVAPAPRPLLSWRLAAGCAVAAAVSLALAWYGGHRWYQAHAAHPVPLGMRTAPTQTVAALARPAAAMSGTITPVTVAAGARHAPPAAGQGAADVGAAPAVAHTAEADSIAQASATAGASARAPAPARASDFAAALPARTRLARPQPVSSSAAAPARPRARGAADDDAASSMPPAGAVAPKSVSPLEPDSLEARAARQAATIELATREARVRRLARLSAPRQRAGGVARKGMTAVDGRQEAPAQLAENAYRRALASLQEGRTGEAIAALQLALRLDAGHEAARQTLVGLLVEANRPDDAMRELQLGLAQDPRQPAMAMLLARLQIERGGNGIETLQRSLPYAGNDAEYHGFLAGALERQQRHREAAEQYQQALRVAPANGVWWMGLGMALQADKRNAEALDAFRKARASAGLSAELQAFVEARIEQLGR